MKVNIVMVEPEIPQNTGNIARTCAITGAKLHLVHPLGFKIDEKTLKRAGLDYWDKLDIEEHEKEKKESISKQTIETADKVVDKQMRIVQEIASLLGETAAETKIALTKLKESIKDE